MNRLVLLKIVNLALIASFLAQAATSLIIFFGINVPKLKALIEFHEYNGLIFIILALAHIVLNWGWIRANFFRKKAPQARP